MADERMTMQEWINQIETAAADISTFGGCLPNYNYHDIKLKDFKALTYRNLYVRMVNLTLKLFKWKVPESFNERIIEMGYLNYGAMCAFRGPIGEYCLPCIPNNMYNIYADPTQVRIMGYNGFTKAVNIKYKTDISTGDIVQAIPDKTPFEGVFSRDNDMMYPYIHYVEEYAYKISDKLVALNIATQRLKCPFTYVVDENELRDTVKKMAEKIESNDDVIILIKPNKMQPIEQSIQLQPNNMKPELVVAIKDSILFDFNMFLETIGINTNPAPDKSQVVLTPELNSNNGLIDLEQNVRFKNREKFCEDAKDILGIDMSVEKNLDEAKEMANQMKEGMLNGFNGAPGKTGQASHEGSSR